MLSVIRMQNKYTLRCAVLLLLLFVSACAKRPPDTGAIRQLTTDPVQELRTRVDQVLSDPAFHNAFWGVAIQSLDNGQVIYERNAEKLLMPASNMKLITGAAALKKLGSDFHYQTTVQTDGSIANNTLLGNLLIIGSGDPTISARFGSGNHFSIFENWANQLKSLGITKIQGDIIGIDDRFDAQRIGYGWSWDDLPYYYATETAALQFAENAITITLVAGQVSDPVVVKKDPDTSYVRVVQNITVQPDSAEAHVDWTYNPESKTVFATGTLPPSGEDYGSFSIHNPAAYFVTALSETLQRNGIIVEGEAYPGAERFYQIPDTTRILIEHQSPSLREILGVLLKVSQNLYAETLLKTIGNGTFSNGIKEVEKILLQIGVAPQNFLILDGSGLSRYNYVTPNGLMQLLNRMHRDPEFETYYNSLAIAGVDGTLRSRMKDTTAQNNVHAKTGSLSNVRSLSGYARTRDGELMGFVMIANNFNTSTETVQHAQDVILQQLTAFSRTRAR
jgi:D-alanyl-D-alanine carboxypeptidase/D-alanyl-D-alanine-endopeptidase (penicillin-binding protein 4)